MRFSTAELESIHRHLDEKWPLPRTCMVCRTNPETWRVSETPVLLPLLTGSRDISASDFRRAVRSIAAAPAVALTCSHCGHIVFFSAVDLNVADTEGHKWSRFGIPSA